MPNNYKEELWLLLGIMAVTVTAGILSGRLLLCLLLGLIIYLAWHLLHLVQLPGLLGNRPATGPQRSIGLWKGVLGDIDALHADIKQHEHTLRHSYTRFQDAVSALPVAMVILGQQGKIDWINPAAERLLNINNIDSSGQVFLDLVRDPVLEEYLGNKAFEQPLVFSPPANKSKSCHCLSPHSLDMSSK